MCNNKITNENLWTTDFASTERTAALAKIQRGYSLEYAMDDFHRGHHCTYFFVFEITRKILNLARTIRA